MKQKIVLLILLLAVCASLGFWFNKHFEIYQETVDLGWSAKARANEFLAAEQYLQKLNFDVSSGDRIRDFSDYSADATLVLENSDMIVSERQLQKLLDWLAAGGHLIVGAAYSKDDAQESDLLMQYLSLRRIDDYCECESPSDDDEEVYENFDTEQLEKNLRQGKTLSEMLRDKNRRLREKKHSADKGDTAVDASETVADDAVDEVEQEAPDYNPDEITLTRWAEYDSEMQLYFDQHSKLVHAAFVDDSDVDQNSAEGISSQVNTATAVQPFYWCGNKHGAQLAQFNLGEGLITVVSQSDIWHSEKIEQLDHALQLWQLVRRSEQVVFLFGTQMPSLFELIWRHAAELLSVTLLLLSAWLWRCSYRFGRPQQISYRQRRSLLEHIFACANLLWREKHSEALLAPLRADTRQMFSRAHPAFHAGDDSELFAAVAHTSSLTEESVHYAFTHSVDNSEREFQICVKTLQKIRDNL